MKFTELNSQLMDAGDVVSPRTAILWGREDLLGKAIESILARAGNWRVINLLGSHDSQSLVNKVETEKPDIVILNEGDSTDFFPPPISMMQYLPDLKLITVNGENNEMDVYTKNRFRIREVTNLITVINNFSQSTPEGGAPHLKDRSITSDKAGKNSRSKK